MITKLKPLPAVGLCLLATWGTPQVGCHESHSATLGTLRPKHYLSRTSKLIEIAMSGQHHDVKVDPLSLRRLIAWVDACCLFRGEEEIRALDDPDFEGIALLPIRPRVKTAPVIERP